MVNPYQLFRVVPLCLLRIMARFVAFCLSFLPNSSLERAVRTNLLLAYPKLDDKARKQLHRQAVINQALSSVESIKCWAMPPSWSIAQINHVVNAEALQNALANPNGMLAIVPHLGTWEMMNAWLNQFGAPTIMYKPVKGKLSNEFVLQGRQRLNATLVPTDASGVKAIFRTLKAGGFSIVLPDHVPDKSGGVIAPFLGVPTLCSTLASKLASKTGCALVGLMCIRNDSGKFTIYCEPLSDPQLYHADPVIATSALNQAMATMIAKHPAQYMWGYRRFKHLPDMPNIYALSPTAVQDYIATTLTPQKLMRTKDSQ